MPSRYRPEPGSLPPEYPLLLALELVLREHALVPQLGQALELARRGGGGRRHGGGRRRPMLRGGRAWAGWRIPPTPPPPTCLAELMIRSPAPIIRSNTPWWNRTSLIASSGISIERFAIHPSRWMTRSDVTTKYDVSHATNLRTGNQIRTNTAMAVAPQSVTSRPVPSSGPYDTAAIQPAITRIVTIAGITRAIQCGPSSRTSFSCSIES